MNSSHEKDPRSELANYQCEVVKAKNSDCPELVERWSLVVEAAKKVADSQTLFGKMHDIQAIPLAPSWTAASESTQASIKYITQSLEAMKMNNIVLAKQYAAVSDSIKKSAALHHYWMTRFHEETVAKHFFEEQQALETSIKYRAKEAEAMHARNPLLTQQWAEAACLAQEAASRARKTKAILAQVGNTVLAHHWMMAAYWTNIAAKLRANVAKAVEQGEKTTVLEHWRAIASCAEQASAYRSKAAKALRAEDKIAALYWTMAAYWIGNASNYKQQATAPWNAASFQAERTSAAYAKAAKSALVWHEQKLITNFWIKRALKLEKKTEELTAKIAKGR